MLLAKTLAPAWAYPATVSYLWASEVSDPTGAGMKPDKVTAGPRDGGAVGPGSVEFHGRRRPMFVETKHWLNPTNACANTICHLWSGRRAHGLA
jgi:hypothetical protein